MPKCIPSRECRRACRNFRARVRTGALLSLTVVLHLSHIARASYSPDGSLLLCGTSNGAIHVFSAVRQHAARACDALYPSFLGLTPLACPALPQAFERLAVLSDAHGSSGVYSICFSADGSQVSCLCTRHMLSCAAGACSSWLARVLPTQCDSPRRCCAARIAPVHVVWRGPAVQGVERGHA